MYLRYLDGRCPVYSIGHHLLAPGNSLAYPAQKEGQLPASPRRMSSAEFSRKGGRPLKAGRGIGKPEKASCGVRSNVLTPVAENNGPSLGPRRPIMRQHDMIVIRSIIK